MAKSLFYKPLAILIIEESYLQRFFHTLYLYQLNLHTGEVIASLELKKQPDLLVPQDNMLYVHTYSYNYTIEMQ